MRSIRALVSSALLVEGLEGPVQVFDLPQRVRHADVAIVVVQVVDVFEADCFDLVDLLLQRHVIIP